MHTGSCICLQARSVAPAAFSRGAQRPAKRSAVEPLQAAAPVADIAADCPSRSDAIVEDVTQLVGNTPMVFLNRVTKVGGGLVRECVRGRPCLAR